MNKANIITVWITGIAASGKTTLAEHLKDDLLKAGIQNVVVLDGDIVRRKLKNFNYSVDDRIAVGTQKALLAKRYNKEGKNVIVTGISHHKATRDKIRRFFKLYSEVYLDCPIEVCAKRDYKGNYKKAYSGEYKHFVGITEAYEHSDNPDLVLNTQKMSIEESARILFEHVLKLLRYNKKKKRDI